MRSTDVTGEFARHGYLVLDEHSLVAPQDGDCTVVSDAVTADLRRRGLPAETVTVTGWVDVADTAFAVLGFGRTRIVGFVHQVTLCTGHVLDGTARQFDPSLPRGWVLPVTDYLVELAVRVTAISHVTIDAATLDVPETNAAPGLLLS